MTKGLQITPNGVNLLIFRSLINEPFDTLKSKINHFTFNPVLYSMSDACIDGEPLVCNPLYC